MKLKIKPQTLKFWILGAGILAFALRALLYTTGIDGRGLIAENHPAAIGLWILTAAVAAALLIFGRSITGPDDYAHSYPVSFAAFLGCFAAAGGLLHTAIREFGNFELPADIFVWVLGVVSALALACVGICRLIRVKPYFLLHAAVCLYFTLRLITLYRRWSADPCLMDYCFYLMAHIGLMLTAYYHAAFDAGMGSHRKLWTCSLAGFVLCCTAVYGCEDAALCVGCAIWCITGLTSLTTPVRRTRPTMKRDADETSGA